MLTVLMSSCRSGIICLRTYSCINRPGTIPKHSFSWSESWQEFCLKRRSTLSEVEMMRSALKGAGHCPQ